MSSTRRTLIQKLGLGGVVLGLFVACAQANLLQNGGFETGAEGDNFAALQLWDIFWGGEWGGQITSSSGMSPYEGTNCMRFNAFGGDAGDWEKGIGQSFAAQSATLYRAEGYLASPAGVRYFTPTNGVCLLRVEFFNTAGATLGGANCEPEFRQNGPTNWTLFDTGPVQAPPDTSTGRVFVLHWPGGDRTQDQDVYVDAVSAVTTAVDYAGTIENPGFEVRNVMDAPLTNLPYWTGLGDAGGAVTNRARSGRRSLQIWYVGSLAAQTWSATQGVKYASAAWLSSTNFTTTNAFGLIVQQFLDATGTNVLLEYISPRFDANSTLPDWTRYQAVGTAPKDTVYGRTLIGIVGDATDYGTSAMWVDDATQGVAEVSAEDFGLLENGGFDEGPTGDAYVLDPDNDLPGWDWLGGIGNGFVVDDTSYSNGQSLTIAYPGSLAGQYFAAETGLTYIVEGRMMTPSSNPMTGETAYAQIILSFFTPDGASTSISSFGTARLTNGTPAGSWIAFGVTNRAPWTGASITGQVLCAILDAESGPYGGQVYFDSIRVHAVTITVNNTQSGSLWNPGFEYSAAGTRLQFVDNWTALGLAGETGREHARTGGNALKIYYPETWVAQDWDAVPGESYSTSAHVMTPSEDRIAGVSNLFALVVLQYVDGTGTNILGEFTSDQFRTNAVADVWQKLEASGAAPEGTVYGRTLVGLGGDTTNFSGAIWFDDCEQAQIGMSAWEQWQWDQFGTNGGENVAADEDYDADNYDNWSEFIAGTQPTNDSSFLSCSPQGAGSGFIIQWPSAVGRYYTVERAEILEGSAFGTVVAGLPSIPPVNVYTDSPPAGLHFFYRISVTTNQP